ncbi:ABC transporter permease [Opitutaceae bacterium]
MDAEIRDHIESREERLIAAGMDPEEARWEAKRSFGHIDQIKEAARDRWSLRWAEGLLKDARFTVASLLRAKTYAGAVVGTLSLGMGVSCFIFNFGSYSLFPLPYPDAERIFWLMARSKQNPEITGQPAVFFEAYREQTTSFTEIAGMTWAMENLVLEGSPVPTPVRYTTENIFDVLGIQPALGRSFSSEEFQAGRNNVVILSDVFWRRYWGGRPDILGQLLRVGREDCIIVGVLPKGLTLPTYHTGEVFRPLALKVDPTQPFSTVLYTVGKLAPGRTIEQATRDLAAVKLSDLPSWASAYFADQEPMMKTLDSARGEIRWLAPAGALLLFAISCLNVMNLMLIRTLRRSREFAVRAALGATRFQLLRLVFLESLAISIAPGIILIAALGWLFPPMFELLTGDANSRYSTYLYWQNYVFVGGMVLISSFATLVLSAKRVMTLTSAKLKIGSGQTGNVPTVNRTVNALVALQAALAVILLTGTGLMTRTFEQFEKVELGFDQRNLVKVQLAFPTGSEPKPADRIAYFDRMKERLLGLPGVAAVAYGQDAVMLDLFGGTAQLEMSDGSYVPTAGSYVAPDYLSTAGARLLKGQWFSGDRGKVEIVINEAFAKARFGDEDPIGQNIRLRVSGNRPFLVVGVVRNIPEGFRAPAGIRFYIAAHTYPQNVSTFLLRFSEQPTGQQAGMIRKAVYELDPNAVVSWIHSVEELTNLMLGREHWVLVLLRILTIAAVGLAAVGLYSIVSYSVESRGKEIGIRIALGATNRDLRDLVLKRGLATVVIGVGAGLASAAGLAQFLKSLLFETTPYEPLVYTVVAVFLVVVALAACWLPARRAARVDAVVALRAE